MTDVLVGKTFTWEQKSITFCKNNIVVTPWINGTYTWLDNQVVQATWYNILHTLTFNSDFTEFISICETDKNKVVGKLVKIHSASKIVSLSIDYKNSSSELCMMGQKYNIDKSSQRENPGPNDSNHCHPYSLLYHSLFKNNRNDNLNFCEIGIAEGRSLLLWEEYFPKAQIYGFERWPKWLANWTSNYADKKRVHVDYMNVLSNDEIINPMQKTGVKFDCIIDDSTHNFLDMIRIIKLSMNFLNDGGMIIIEDIQKAFDESWFYNELSDILDQFAKVFFVDLEHDRRNSGMVNNDKVLVLIKKGESVFDFNLI